MTAYRWEALTSPELAALDMDAAVAVVPLGAVEQHGPHLPLSVDGDINSAVLEAALVALPGEVDALILPQHPVGLSTEHADMPGTLTLAPETMLALLRDLGLSLADNGVRRAILLNSHGGQPALLDLAAQIWRDEHAMLAVPVNAFRLWRREDHLPADKAAYDIHAGAIETAIMRHLDPGAVREDAVSDSPSGLSDLREALESAAPGAGARTAWMAEDLSRDGAAGDATLGDAAMGERLVAEAGAALARIIAAAATADLP